jgi:DNA-binding response OmpR family regulator
LTVDDDPLVYEELSAYLLDHGYDVFRAQDAAECLETLKKQKDKIKVILMDLQLPDKDGLALITQIRELTNCPLLLVSKRDETATKVIGLELGADDYIEKPFDKQELLARIKASLRRHYEVPETTGHDDKNNKEHDTLSGAMPPHEFFKFGKWLLDTQKFMLVHEDGHEVELTRGEFDLLKLFVKAPGRVLSREQLFEFAKDDDYESYDRAIDIQVSRLRKKLGDDPKTPNLIKTMHGAGYMFNSEVTKSA